MLEILYEVGPILAVNKPAGLLTQAPKGIDSLEIQVKKYIQRAGDGDESNTYLGVPHRLDRPVSGVILFGKTTRATHRLSEQFEARKIDKTYWALVEGVIEEDTGRWIDYMRKVPNRPIAEIVPPINPDAREAVLHFTVKQRAEDWTWLEIKLETGRMHQIRLQSSVHGHPILGDAMYGSTRLFGEPFEDERLRAIALHAHSITFTDPTTKEAVTLEAPLPDTWKQ